ncbi:AfsR/SARP family transcriptional regulator [Saccharothrix obliqua]|uniref:AfsR/SARP family transcriptional regulator n=1 Tax=Saccharothrix obliqua TaxID=2861747 RepID=UPI001C5E1939|nr:AfsR/SARP family transcriptional regulator [Saccharothrix obliqua]MBW4721938.1 tetratricopeptide repeat protein [Saccharothrix obliqua]
MLSGIRYAALGPLTAWRDDRRIELGWAKQQAVLGVLLLELNRPVPLSRIVDGVWGERGPRDARNAVQTYVSRLRRVLRVPQHPEPLVLTDGGYLLQGDPAGLDVVVFDRHLDEAHARYRDHDVPGSAEHVEAALALWRGEPFSGLGGPLLEAERRRLRERHLSAQVLHARTGLDQGRGAESLAQLTRLAAAHPLHERVAALLMLALHRSGSRAAALDVYHATRRRLADELGVDPGDEIQALYERILRGDADLAARPARPRSRNTLPRDVADFTGREPELALLLGDAPAPRTAEQAREPAVAVAAAVGLVGHAPAADRAASSVVPAREAWARVVPAPARSAWRGRGEAAVWVVDGPPGVGKSALAVHAAHRLAGRYPDAQLYVDLRGHAAGHAPVDPAAALDVLLRALGVPAERIPADPDARAGLWRAELAERTALVVLDDAADAEQVRPLLPGSGRSLTLVTSRRRLVELAAARTLSVDVLPEEHAVELFGRIVADGRAADEPGPVAEAVELCGRLPLAIRLAAARLGTRPAWTVAHLTDRLRRDRLDGVAAAFALSYENLTVEQRRLFRLLGLHPGPDFDAPAAAALADRDPATAERLLENLVDVHLVGQPRAGRYRFHDLVREFARDAAHRNEAEADRFRAARRLAHHYLTAARAAVRGLAPHEADPAAHARALAWLDAERVNVLLSTQPRDVAPVLHHYLHLRNHVADALTVDTWALSAAGDRAEEGATWQRLGADHLRLGHHDQALRGYERAREIFTDLGERARVAAALRELGLLHGLAGRTAAAAAANGEALAIARELGDRAGEVAALTNLGAAHRRAGEDARALELLGRALDLARSTGDRVGEAGARCELAHVAHRLGRAEDALDDYRRACALARRNGDRAGELRALVGIGEVHLTLGDHPAALDHLTRALTEARHDGHRAGETAALLALGRAHAALGDRAEAATHYAEALDIARDTGDRVREAQARTALGGSTNEPGA